MTPQERYKAKQRRREAEARFRSNLDLVINYTQNPQIHRVAPAATPKEAVPPPKPDQSAPDGLRLHLARATLARQQATGTPPRL